MNIFSACNFTSDHEFDADQDGLTVSKNEIVVLRDGRPGLEKRKGRTSGGATVEYHTPSVTRGGLTGANEAS